MPQKTIRAADHLINTLITQGVSSVFGVPGESYLPLLDAMRDRAESISFITCRQEGGATMAAEAQGKLTGRPGICMVTRGPGATNASAGLHIAYQDSTPMILFIGQVARDMIEREAFQEMDYRRMFGPMAKWVAEIDDPSRIQEYVIRAFRTAMSGRPGPVVLALPEDMLYDEIIAPPAPRFIEKPKFGPAQETLNTLKDALAQAANPLIIAGGPSWAPKAIAALQTFSEKQNIPVAASFRSQALFDNRHPNYIGHFSVGKTPFLAEALDETDVLICIGARLGEITTVGYSLLDVPVPKQKIAHIYPQGEEIGRVYEPEIALVSDMETFCVEAAQWPTLRENKTNQRTNILNQHYARFADASALKGDWLAQCFAYLSETTPKDAIICNGAGNYAGWLQRFFKYKAPATQLAPTSGSMGYGLPAAIGAAITQPEKEIYAIAGDGCFMMTCQEMATIMHHDLKLTVIIVNNGRYGTIRAHQEREFPNKPAGTDLTNPDFCAFAQSFGATSHLVNDLNSFKAALARAREDAGFSLIEIKADPNLLAPGKLLAH